MSSKFKQLSARFLKLLRLEKIDQHESLTFLYKNYNIRPSEVITTIAILLLAIVLVLDGFNLIASVVCFLFPLFRCLEILAAE